MRTLKNGWNLLGTLFRLPHGSFGYFSYFGARLKFMAVEKPEYVTAVTDDCDQNRRRQSSFSIQRLQGD